MSRPQIAWVFSGQGSEWPGMAHEAYRDLPAFRQALDEYDALLRPYCGFSVLETLRDGDPTRLQHTQVAQPCLFALQSSLARFLMSEGAELQAVVGHSVGEVAAAHAANVLDASTAARLIAARGRALASLHGRGRMLAVIAKADEAPSLVAELGEGVALAAINGPESFVLSILEEEFERTLHQLSLRQMRNVLVNRYYPFHSPALDPLLAGCQEAFSFVRPRAAEVVLVSSVSGTTLRGTELDGTYWVRNVRQCVRFRDALQVLADQGYSSFLEVGPQPMFARHIEGVAATKRAVTVAATLQRGRSSRETLGRAVQLARPATDSGVIEHAPSDAQKTLHLLERLHPNDSSYNTTLSVRLHGSLDFAALREAAEQVVQRHAALRTKWKISGNELRAVVLPKLAPRVELIDVSAHNERDMRALIKAAHDRPFALDRDSAVRIDVFRRSETDHVVLVTAHHAMADFRSLELFTAELNEIYTAITSGTPRPEGVSRSISYSEFCGQQTAYLRSAAAASARAYFAERLKDPPKPVEWPCFSRTDPNACDTHAFALDAALCAQINTFARNHGVTAFMVLLAAWSEVIAEHTGERDVIVGTPFSIRDRRTRDTIGHLVNVLPLRIRSAAEASFAELVEQARLVTVEGMAHQAYPFRRIVADVAAPRAGGRNPLFQTMLTLQQPSLADGWGQEHLGEEHVARAWAGLAISAWSVSQQEGQVDLSLRISAYKDRYRAALSARLSCVPASLLSHLCDRFTDILRAGLDCPSAPRSEFSQLPPQRVESIRKSMNSLPALLPASDDLVSRLHKSAKAHPHRPAVSDGTTQLTYAELDERALALAAALLDAGAAAGERIGIHCRPGVAFVVAMIAIQKLGAAYVPLEPGLPAERLKRMVEIGHVSHAVIDAASESVLPPSVRTTIASMTGRTRDLPFPGPLARAYTLFTSGSTGEPKGIDVRHGSVVAMLDATSARIDAGATDTWVWFHAASFDLSVWEIFGCLCSGGRLLVTSPTLRSTPDAFADWLEGEQASVLLHTPSALRMLADELDRKPRKMSALRVILSCGEALPGPTALRFLQRGWPVWNMYGPAEATVFSTAQAVDERLAAEDVVPIGTGLGHVEVHLLDAQLRPLPPGAAGELYISGQGVAEGYANRPELTDERFRSSELHQGLRLYQTGDHCLWDGATLRFRGRRDQQVKVRGYRVETSELEGALRSFPGVSDAAIVVEHEDGTNHLAAAVVAREGVTCSVEALRVHLAGMLPHYMQPRRVTQIPKMPLNAHGKVDRKALARILDEQKALAQPPALAARDSLESTIESIWCEVLCVPRVGLDDGFFAIGGTSLDLMRVFDRLSVLPSAAPLTPTLLFRHPTVRSVARLLRGSQHIGGEAEHGRTRGERRRATQTAETLAKRRLSARPRTSH